ncbi:MAG: HlyD family secretion protein [Calothrix sp. C42_A2020_038]|nr:HlyD family secretion protein [Calothrix sp. C42_A2020_038]
MEYSDSPGQLKQVELLQVQQITENFTPLNQDKSEQTTEAAPQTQSSNLTTTANSQIVSATGVVVQSKRKLKPNQLLLRSLLFAGAVATIIPGLIRWRYVQTYEKTDNAYVFTDTYAINSRIPGQVVSVIATENQVVQKGAVLVKLDASKYQAKVQEAKVNLEQAQQQVRKTTINLGAAKAKIKNQPKLVIVGQNDAAVVSAHSEVKATQSQLRRIEPGLVKAELDYARNIKLQQSGFIPLKTLEQAKIKYDDLLKQHNLFTEKLKLAQSKFIAAQQNYLDVQIKLTQQKIETNLQNLQQTQAKLQQSDSTQVITNKQKSMQLETKFAAKQEQHKKTIARLTQQKQVVKQQSIKQLLMEEYLKGQIYVKTAHTALKQAQAQLKNAEYQLYYTKIIAPNNGQINIKRAQTGQKVQAGQTLMSLVTSKPWIAADFEDEQLQKIKPGQLVQIQLKTLTNKTFTGKVKSISPFSKKEYYHARPLVKISFDSKTLGDYKPQITPGIPASIKVKLE